MEALLGCSEDYTGKETGDEEKASTPFYAS